MTKYSLAAMCVTVMAVTGPIVRELPSSPRVGSGATYASADCELQPMTPSQRAELLKARETVWRAWFGGDEAALRTLLPPETIALSQGPDGWTTRDGIIKASSEFARNGGTLLKLEFPRTDIQQYGGTAIIYTSYLFETQTNGKKTSERGKAVEIFVRRGSGWVNSGWQLMADGTT
jgi:hypothetical protein